MASVLFSISLCICKNNIWTYNRIIFLCSVNQGTKEGQDPMYLAPVCNSSRPAAALAPAPLAPLVAKEKMQPFTYSCFLLLTEPAWTTSSHVDVLSIDRSLRLDKVNSAWCQLYSWTSNTFHHKQLIWNKCSPLYLSNFPWTTQNRVSLADSWREGTRSCTEWSSRLDGVITTCKLRSRCSISKTKFPYTINTLCISVGLDSLSTYPSHDT